MPVLLDGVVVGAVNIESRSVLDPTDLPALQQVAAGLATRLAALGGLPEPSPAQRLALAVLDLTTAEDAGALRARVVRAAVEVSGVPTAALLPLARDRAPSVAVGPLADRLAAWGPHQVAIAAGWVTAGTSSHFPGGEAVPPGYDFLQQAGVSGLSVHPLAVGGVLTDLLVTATDEPRRPAPTVVEALELLAVQAAASLALLEVRADLARARDDAERRAALTTAVLETVDVGVVACDARGRLTLFNRATRDFHRAAMDPTSTRRPCPPPTTCARPTARHRSTRVGSPSPGCWPARRSATPRSSSPPPGSRCARSPATAASCATVRARPTAPS